MKIVVAMSGGVDSSTAAALLVEAGHEVIGLAMKTHSLHPQGNRACCTPDDMRDARRVADHLKIPFYVLNYEDVFVEEVIKPFAEAYLNGRTPNPCVECNDKVKFRPLLQRAQFLGADKLATGHYARIVETNDGPLLQRAADRHKDQSYFLYRLNAEQLRHIMFPLGDMDKTTVREHARRLGLPVAEKTESQEICFVGAEGYANTVQTISGKIGKKGPIVDGRGKILGHHDGIHHFTLGQRRGLGIASSAPLYVTQVNAHTGVVQVGERQALLVQNVQIDNLVWTGTKPNSEEILWIQTRYRDTPKRARVQLTRPNIVTAVFLEPQPESAPGQAAVFYRDEHVVGGGTLMARTPVAEATPSSLRAL